MGVLTNTRRLVYYCFIGSPQSTCDKDAIQIVSKQVEIFR
jgi:hypothetical protein